MFPCPRSCLRIWSRETGFAVPSRVSLLISILRLNLVLTYGIPPDFLRGVRRGVSDLKVAVNTIVPRSPFFSICTSKPTLFTHMKKNAVEYLRQ